jgi:hypothetical protein
MAKSNVVINNFLSGVLDPRASARIDTEAFNRGLLRGINITPVHLGGVRRRPGLKYLYSLPNQITRISGGVSVTAPNGGTTGNANDDSETTYLATTVNVSTNDPYVVVHYDLGSAQAVLFADAMGIRSDSGSSTQFHIQYSTNDTDWTTLGAAFYIDTTARHYRRKGPFTARYWRIVKIGGTSMGTAKITISGFNLWLDSGAMSEGRTISFEVSTSEQYTVVLTDRSATVFNNGVLADHQPMPYESADLSEIDAASFAETMALVHEDYSPRFLVRESATNFQQFEVDFNNIPQIDYADTSSPTPVSDQQSLAFTSFVEGDTFQLSLEGATTGAITYSGANATTAANIAREVQKLWSVQAFDGVSCSGVGPFVVTFANASAAAYDKMTGTTLTGTGTIAVTHSITGTSRKEDVWSATRGYPRSVEFFEGRMYFGGTLSRQQSVIGSQVNNILEFEIGEGLDDDVVFVTLNGRQLNAIQGMFAGRSLQLFTSGGEFRFVKESGVPITPGDYPVNQTQYGAAKVRPVTIDGATIYIQRNRKSVRDFRFDYTENAYNSLGVSSLAPHLIYDVRDLAAWNGSAIDEINLVFVVNGTNPDTSSDAFGPGTVAVYNSRKESNISAWTIWTTDGEFKGVSTINQDIFFIVKRTLGGVDVLTFEQANADYYTDCAIQVTNAPASATVTGLGHLNGEDCRVRADGFILENVTPSAGSATIERVSSLVEVGLDWTPDVTPMPLQTMTPNGTNLMRKRRIVKVRAKVRNTLGLLVNGRPLPDRYFDIDDFDAPATPFTGVHVLEETTNWDEQEDKLVSFTQVDPLPMEILSIDVQLEGDV